jgi:hypothetical protein
MATATDKDTGDGNAVPARAPKPRPWRVRKHDENNFGNGGVVFTGDATLDDNGERQARQYIKAHHPRGREVHLSGPGGEMLHYSADLETQDGPDAAWIEYSEDEDA